MGLLQQRKPYDDHGDSLLRGWVLSERALWLFLNGVGADGWGDILHFTVNCKFLLLSSVSASLAEVLP